MNFAEDGSKAEDRGVPKARQLHKAWTQVVKSGRKKEFAAAQDKIK